MSTNSLVAAPVDTATPLSGTGLLESGSQLAAAIESGSWVEGGLAGIGVALDTAAAVIDPLGSLIGAGLGWLIDHLEPLKGWFNDFTGDAGEVAAFGQTWANIQAQLQGAGDELTRVLGDVDQLAGEAMDAYRRFQSEAAQHLAGAASWAGAMSTGLQIASTIVQVVHDVVRDVLSQLVGSIIAWAAEAVFTLGLATPVIVAQVTTKVASWTAKVGKTVVEALTSCKALSKLLDDLTRLLDEAGSLFRSVLNGGGPSTPRTPTNTPVRNPDAPTTPRGPDDAPTTPRGPGDAPTTPRGPDDAPTTPPRSPDEDPSTTPRDPDDATPPARDPDDTVPPLSDDLRDEIQAMEPGSRPDPSTYLPESYIREHLARFDEGATRFMTENNLNKYGIAQRDGTSFVMPTSEVNDLMRSTGGDPRAMEDALGLPEGFLDSGVVRVDIPEENLPGLRMPSGNEAGANDQWIPGGKLPTGVSEAVIDGGTIPDGGYNVSSF